MTSTTEQVEGTGDNNNKEAVSIPDLNPEMLENLNSMQERLDKAATPAAYIQSLPPSVRRRLKALKRLQSSVMTIESAFHEEIHQLECKYQTLYEPLHQKRYQIISAKVEPNDEECVWESEEESERKDKINSAETNGLKPADALEPTQQDENVSGIPKFWLRIFKNVTLLAELIEEHDEPILEHLQDIRVKLASPDEQMAFTLEFVFEPNDYFTNEILTKHYELTCKPDPEEPLSYGGPEIVKCKGCTIDWKEGKNVTIKKIKKVQSHRGHGAKRTILKTVQANSFFNFFSPPTPPEDEEDEEIEDVLSNDFEVGHFLRDRVIPNAVLFFTGEALDDEDEYDDDDGEEVIIDHMESEKGSECGEEEGEDENEA